MGEHTFGRLDHSHLAAKTPDGLGHLDADRPTTQYQQTPWHRFHTGHLAVGPDAFQVAQPRDRGHHRVRAGRQDNVPRGVGNPIHFDHAGSRKPARAANQVDALACQPALLAGIGVVRDHEIAVRQRRLDVDVGVACCLARLLGSFPGAQQRLGWDARPVGALAADELTFHDGHMQSTVGQLACAMLARRAAAQDDCIVGDRHHDPSCLHTGTTTTSSVLSTTGTPLRRADFHCPPREPVSASHSHRLSSKVQGRRSEQLAADREYR